jgi:outer membrane protein assembly factor BamA
MQAICLSRPFHLWVSTGMNLYTIQHWEDDEHEDYRSRMFYKQERNMLRIHTDLNGPLQGDKLRWAAGFEVYDIRPASVDIERLNKGLSDDKKLPPVDEQPGLYELYQQWGLIPEADTDGGMFVSLKAGLVYDTRDFQPNPMKGIWSDVILYAAPKPFSDLNEGFMRLNITHRQYFTLVPDKLSFVYRLSYQSNLGTSVPFYAQPLMITTQLRGAYSEGLGGQRSLRGVLRNRVVGNDFVYGNAEFRWKFFQTRLINQNFYLALNPFIDAGQVVRKIDIEDQVNSLKQTYINVAWDDYFDFGAEKLHWAAGIGLKVVMNENFIISADYGKPFNSQDGKSGLYIGLNYLF